MGRLSAARGVPVRGLRQMTVLQALHWAFAVEKASVDFDDFAAPVGRDTIDRLIRQGLLGCKVDGGGRSFPHDDADVIASLVARLPHAHGGASMAVRVAQLARIGASPDWMPGARPACVPQEVRLTKHGARARSECVGQVVTMFRGRKVVHDVMACAVTYRPSRDEIAAMRAEYDAWFGAVAWLWEALRGGGLRTVQVMGGLPAFRPWERRGIDGQDVKV